jgi:hypothetical protein
MRYRRVRALFLLTVVVPACAGPGRVAPSGHGSVESVRLVTEDIPRFWRAFDRLPGDVTFEDAAEIFERDYLNGGTAGLAAFQEARFEDAERFAEAVLDAREYYAAVRENTLAIDTSVVLRDRILDSFREFKRLYPRGSFPDVYFIVGWLRTGGINVTPGLVIGAELFARDAATPVEELNEWARANTKPFEWLPHIVAHELAHRFQLGRWRNTLLHQAMREGAADYVAEQVSGGHINPRAHTYGQAHEAELWNEFVMVMSGSDFGDWLYAQPGDGRPADLGYFIGYRIVEAYHQRASDKATALRDIVELRDFLGIFEASGYAERFQ